MITAKSILTRKETFDLEYPTVSKHDALEAMIEFAKLHVEAALKEASEKAELDYFNGSCRECGRDKINDSSILEAYPLKNIK